MTFEELRKELRTPKQRYAIKAKTGTGNEIVVFTWVGSPEFGIERAKREAVEFGMTDLYDFKAEYVG